VSVDAYATPGSISIDTEPAVRTQLKALTVGTLGLGGNTQLHTDLDGLLDQVDRSRRMAHRTVSVAALPLVLQAWFVIFLAVGYGTEGRRRELGLLAMRGTRPWVRWLLAAGEVLTP